MRNDRIDTGPLSVTQDSPLSLVVSGSVGFHYEGEAHLLDSGDSVHFDTPSERELGKRYARQMRRLQRQCQNEKAQDPSKPESTAP